MFPVSKNKIECESLTTKRSYDSEIVINQLSKEFHSKCYICGGDVGTSLRVEHFVPHLNRSEYMYDWKNLFLACDYCNNIKSDTYNNRNKAIINPMYRNPIHEIKVNWGEQLKRKITFTGTSKDLEVANSVELLNKIFISKPRESAAYTYKRDSLRRRLFNELREFFYVFDELVMDNPLPGREAELVLKLKDFLHVRSDFYEYKVSLIYHDDVLRKETERLLGYRL